MNIRSQQEKEEFAEKVANTMVANLKWGSIGERRRELYGMSTLVSEAVGRRMERMKGKYAEASSAGEKGAGGKEKDPFDEFEA